MADLTTYSYSELAKKLRLIAIKQAKENKYPYANTWLNMSDKQAVDNAIKENPDIADLLYEPTVSEVIPFSLAQPFTGEDNPQWYKEYTSIYC